MVRVYQHLGIRRENQARLRFAKPLAHALFRLAARDWIDANIQYLHTRKLFGGQRIAGNQAMLGAGRVQFALDNFNLSNRPRQPRHRNFIR